MSFLDNSFLPRNSQVPSVSGGQNDSPFDSLANTESQFVADQKQHKQEQGQGTRNILGTLGGFAKLIPGGDLVGAGLGVIGSIIGLLK